MPCSQLIYFEQYVHEYSSDSPV